MAERQQRQRLHALRNDRNLARFVIEGRATGKQLGTGSYGSVEEVCMKEITESGEPASLLFIILGCCEWTNMCWKEAP